MIVGAWVDRSHDRSGWVIGYPGVDRFAAAEDRNHATSALLALQPVPSVFIEQATLGMVDAVI